MQISDVNEALDVELPHVDWDTLGGFVFSTLGHVPEPGELVERDRWQFIAAEVEGRRVRQVRVVGPPDETVDPPEPELVHTPGTERTAPGDDADR